MTQFRRSLFSLQSAMFQSLTELHKIPDIAMVLTRLSNQLALLAPLI